MDDIQILLYIVIAVIALISNVIKKKNKQKAEQQAQSQEEQYDEPSQSSPTKSFEDLLREFTGEETTSSKPTPQREPAKRKSFSDSYDDEAQRVYEESVKRASKMTPKKRDQHVTKISDERHTGSFQHFGGYEEQDNNVQNEFIEMLQDAEGAKKAIILSEIINRKY